VNYQTVAEITNPNPAAVGTWACNMALVPHPIGFLYHDETDSVGSALGCVLNSQLTGVTHADKYTSLWGVAERWRLAYMSVSIYQDGADLTNQGTFVACQSVVKPSVYHASEWSPGGLLQAAPRICAFLTADKPDYSKSQSMPNAYFNRSKEGVYMPLKLTETHQRWHSAGKSMMIAAPAFAANLVALLPTATSSVVYPFPGLVQFYQAAPGQVMNGESTSDLCNDVWGFVCAKNLALTTKLQVFIRAGFEMQVQPGSLLSPQQRLSPPQDAVALNNYFTISRELKDAYPVEYNDAGKIWDAISGVAKTAAGILSAIPHPIAQGIGAAVGGASTVGDVIRRAIAGADAGRNAGSQADREIAQRVVQAPAPVPVRVTAVPIPQPSTRRVRRRRVRRAAAYSQRRKRVQV
jgi:hypothetical protein